MERIEKSLQKKFEDCKIQRLASGGESFIYLVVRANGERLAVKFPRRNHRRGLEAYANEIAHYLSLDEAARRSFVPILELDANGPFLVTKLVGEGRTLLDYLSSYGPEADPLFILNTMHNIATTIKYLHDRHICHADIKPGNVLVETDHDGRPENFLLGDLTIAAPFGSRTPYLPQGSMAGTPQFMPPAARAGDPIIRAEWDLYALMVTFQSLALGELPFNNGINPSHLSSHRAFGRDLQMLIRSPYSILKESGVSPVVSAISFHQFDSIDKLVDGISAGIDALRSNDIERFFVRFYGPHVLGSLPEQEAASKIYQSDELIERLGTSHENTRLGLKKEQFAPIYLAYRTLPKR